MGWKRNAAIGVGGVCYVFSAVTLVDYEVKKRRTVLRTDRLPVKAVGYASIAVASLPLVLGSLVSEATEALDDGIDALANWLRKRYKK